MLGSQGYGHPELFQGEKNDKEPEAATQGKQRGSAGNAKSGSTKGNKQGRNSRRDSVGVVPLLLEPPPTKQRRGSLQLPFREHFFNKGGGGGGAVPDTAKGTDALKVYDDSFGSLRGRGRAPNLSVDDTFYPPMSPQGTWTEGTSKKNKSQKLSVVNLFTPGNKVRPGKQHYYKGQSEDSIFDISFHWRYCPLEVPGRVE
ncbi:pleckstrin-like protein domain-containing family G member 5 [Elysia marginata]|uniref:Pleckstrin-like protein domain-containing family G member 5 n=1 Tax=Elysia marginata TaxID=1093978 RepID=A0AAV4IR37_9GAST|nr:pleckstrin-like protein domain-containing family G member 5 [Elysia marginata]